MGLFDLFPKRRSVHEQALKTAQALELFCDHIVVTFVKPEENTLERNHEFVHYLLVTELIMGHMFSNKSSAHLAEKVHPSVLARLSGAKLKLDLVLQDEDKIRASDQNTLRLVAMICHLADTVQGVLRDDPDYLRSAKR